MSYTFKGSLPWMRGRFNLRESGVEAGSATPSDVRAILVMSNYDGDELDTHVDDVNTLDEYDGTGYVRKQLAAQDVFLTGTAQVFSADPLTWSALGAGSRPCVGMVIYQHNTNDTDSRLIAFLNTGGFPFVGTGIDVPFTFPDGLLELDDE